MIHHATADFWQCYLALPTQVRDGADRAFALLKADPKHPSLHFKKLYRFWSARIGLHYRALGIEVSDGDEREVIRKGKSALQRRRRLKYFDG